MILLVVNLTFDSVVKIEYQLVYFLYTKHIKYAKCWSWLETVNHWNFLIHFLALISSTELAGKLGNCQLIRVYASAGRKFSETRLHDTTALLLTLVC